MGKPAAVLGGLEAHQSAGETDHSDGSLGGLGDVEQVVEQRLVLVVGEQVEFIQDEQHGPAAAAIACTETQKPNIQTFSVLQFGSKQLKLDNSSKCSDLSSTLPARTPDSPQNFPKELNTNRFF